MSICTSPFVAPTPRLLILSYFEKGPLFNSNHHQPKMSFNIKNSFVSRAVVEDDQEKQLESDGNQKEGLNMYNVH